MVTRWQCNSDLNLSHGTRLDCFEGALERLEVDRPVLIDGSAAESVKVGADEAVRRLSDFEDVILAQTRLVRSSKKFRQDRLTRDRRRNVNLDLDVESTYIRLKTIWKFWTYSFLNSSFYLSILFCNKDVESTMNSHDLLTEYTRLR